jgi:hypothetical protein
MDDEGDNVELTHELVEYLNKEQHEWRGDYGFAAEDPGLDGCATRTAAKSVHLPHKEGRRRTSKYLEWAHIDIVSPMPVKSAGGREYCVIVD